MDEHYFNSTRKLVNAESQLLGQVPTVGKKTLPQIRELRVLGSLSEFIERTQNKRIEISLGTYYLGKSNISSDA